MKTAYTHCAVFDGCAESTMQQDMTILVDGDKIAAVQPGDALIPDGYTVRVCTGQYAVPGLINLHMHLFGSGKPSKALAGGGNQQAILKMVKKWPGSKVLDGMVAAHLKAALHAGTTTVRAVGDFYYSDVRARKKIANGKLQGPRLLVSGPALTVPGGHGDGTFGETATDAQGFAALVAERFAHKVDFIKICVTGGVMDAKKKGEPGELRMNLAQTKAVCAAAHKLGYHVASHTESVEGVRVALAGGVDTIEHGSTVDAETAALYRQHASALVCTISPAFPLAKLDTSLTLLPEVAKYNAVVVWQGIVEGAKAALAAGIPVGLGTDASCPFVAPYDMWREVYYFATQVGVGNAFALHTATLQNAKILDIDKETGSLQAGKCADILFVNQNPLEDLRALRTAAMVVHKGQLIARPHVKKDAAIETALAPFVAD